MSDSISRQALLDKFTPWLKVKGYSEGERNMLKAVLYEIQEFPSAQPQRMRGKWTYGEDEYGIDGYHCDKCGFFVPWDYAHKFINYIEDYNFCPNCGADMRGVKEA